MEFDKETALIQAAGEMQSVTVSPEDEADCQLDSPEFMTDDFRVNSFKVEPCPKRFSHDWTTCPFAHPGEKARRRDPTTCKYAAIACIDMKNTNFCPRGEECPYAHNVFEYWMHPTRYRTQMCNDGVNCRRKICFFAHRKNELRTPPHKPGFPVEWHKGKKHHRSRSGSVRAPKPTNPPKTNLVGARSKSVPTDAKSALDSKKPEELRKATTFEAGQFGDAGSHLQRSLEFIAQHGSGLPMRETWDMEIVPQPPVSSVTPGETFGQWTSPRQPRRSLDVPQPEPTILTNEASLMPSSTPSSDMEVVSLIQSLMAQTGYGDSPNPFSIAPSKESLKNLGCLPGNDALTHRASFDSQVGRNLGSIRPGVSLGITEPVTRMPDGYGSPQRHVLMENQSGGSPQRLHSNIGSQQGSPGGNFTSLSADFSIPRRLSADLASPQRVSADFAAPQRRSGDFFSSQRVSGDLTASPEYFLQGSLMKPQRFLQGFSPYPMMGSQGGLVASMGSLSVGDSLNQRPGHLGPYIASQECAAAADVTRNGSLHVGF